MRTNSEFAAGSAFLFPAAAPPADGEHPAWCACNGCTTRQVTALTSPLRPGELADQPVRKES